MGAASPSKLGTRFSFGGRLTCPERHVLAALRQRLSASQLDAPNGKINSDGSRQAIGANFLTEVTEPLDGTLTTKVVKVIEGVDQTLGIDPSNLAAIGARA